MRIIVEHTHNFSARLIQIWMAVDALVHGKKPAFTFNHALIEHNGIVWEALSPRVKRWTLADHYAQKKFEKDYEAQGFELNLNAAELARAITYLNGQEGKHYEYFNFVFHPLKTIYDFWLGSRTDKRQYCYELAIRAMNRTGRYNIDPFLNPREFYETITALH